MNMQIQQTKKTKQAIRNNNKKNWVAEFKLPIAAAPEIMDMTAHAVISDLTEGLGNPPLIITGDEFTSLNRNITICMEGVGNNIPYAFQKLKEVYSEVFTILN